MESFSVMGFNYFDVIIAAVILILGLKGFINGFIREFFGLIGLVLGVFLASRLADTAAAFIDKNLLHLENSALLKLLGFLAILAMIWLGATILGTIFSKLSEEAPGPLSRLFGFLSGAAKYFIVFALIITALSNVQLAKDKLLKYFEQSRLYPYLLQTGSYLIYLESTQQTVQKSESSKSPKADIIVSPTKRQDGNSTTADNKLKRSSEISEEKSL